MIPLLMVLASPPPVVEIPVVVTPPVVVGADAPPVKARPFVMKYQDVYDRVVGKKPGKADAVRIAVGRDEAGYERADDVPAGVKPGLYRCWYEDGEPRWEAVSADRPVADAAKKVLRGAAEVVLPPYPAVQYRLAPSNPFQNCGPTG